MIVLDTNVVSELMRPTPDPAVVAWFSGLDRSAVFLNAVTNYEIRFGIERLQNGQRKDRLFSTWSALLITFLPGQVLPLDHDAAEQAALFKAFLIARGGNRDICDLLISGIAVRHGATIATRNVRHFEGLQIDIIDPWAAS